MTTYAIEDKITGQTIGWAQAINGKLVADPALIARGIVRYPDAPASGGDATVGFSSANFSVSRPNLTQPYFFEVDRVGSLAGACSVNWTTVDGTAIGCPADASTPVGDYTISSGVLNWNAGDGSPQQIQVPIFQANSSPSHGVSPDLLFTIELSGAVGVGLAISETTVSILGTTVFSTNTTENEAAQAVSNTDQTITLTVERRGKLVGAASVDYQFVAGPDTPAGVDGVDFDTVSGTLNWADGESGTKNVPVHFRHNAGRTEQTYASLNLSNPQPGGDDVSLQGGFEFFMQP